MQSREDLAIRYFDKFGELFDSRRIPPDIYENIDELMKMALKRGKPLTRAELEIVGEVPENARI